jgi:hypothetical protein
MVRYISVACLLIVSLISCEKAESPIELPPQGTSKITSVTMGIDYQTQVYFSFTSGIVKTAPVNSWDFALESTPEGYHLFQNGGKNIYSYNTKLTDAAAVAKNANFYRSLPTDSFQFDAPCGLPDSTVMKNWRNPDGSSKKEVYIININRTSYKKIVLNSVSAIAYSLSYSDLDGKDMKTIDIPKDPLCNYSYFSFDNGGTVVAPEPVKTTWDVVFTRYRYFFVKEQLPYIVSGVLLNPYNTAAVEDSVSGYTNITYPTIATSPFSIYRDVIGYDWKDVKVDINTNTAVYTTKPKNCYVVRTQTDGFWKIHFLNFYDTNKEKGTPTFEYEQIQ